ncbi:hypothetical protein F0562_027041 [Nyssa sinensis]|uniref:HMA domain-containing protein n=1 Tax=Nyssa sinensis TaxID=561372 RepID=A0A5J5B621_9ASTE|nr:hypothetical protein F0562_027041 [Nyssa sinensis]
MHCEACARKVARTLRGFQGVEDVRADYKASKVVVKGKTADPIKVWERIQKKSKRGRKVELISPLPKPPAEDKPKQEKKDESPAVITVVLKVQLHCIACSQVLQKRIEKIRGVESVTTELAKDQVIVKGIIDPAKLVNDVYKKTKKQVSIVKDEEKKEEEKKDETKEENKGGEEGKEEDDNGDHINKSEYWPPEYYMEYAYPPTIFSDDNPHACSVM